MARLPYVVYGLVIFALSWLPLPHGTPVAFFAVQAIAYLAVGGAAGWLLRLRPVIVSTFVAQAVVVVLVGWVVDRWGLFLLIVVGTVLAACLGALAGSRLRAVRAAAASSPA